MGMPQHFYHGGLMNTTLRCFDANQKRPGLPEDVGVLVGKQGADYVDVTLAHVGLDGAQTMVLEAGSFGQHTFTFVSMNGQDIPVHDRWLSVELDPGAQAHLHIGLTRYTNKPNYDTPWMTKKESEPILLDRRYVPMDTYAHVSSEIPKYKRLKQ
jgi:hypothetical protein